jgi:vacuolar-type H+-ATPase subunit H
VAIISREMATLLFRFEQDWVFMHHASHATAKHGPSLLEVVAEHESGLMAKVADAELQAKTLLDEAHTEAAGFLTEDYAQLEREVSDMRKRATEQRESVATGIRAASDAKVAAIRQQSAAKVETVFQEVVRRVVPRS